MLLSPKSLSLFVLVASSGLAFAADGTTTTIGKTPSVTPPAMDNPATPTGTVSQGPAETGPHGQVDITKPMPNVVPSSPRMNDDRPVQPKP